MTSWFPLLTLAAAMAAEPYTHDAARTEEFRPRDGLPNTFAKIAGGGPVRVAYLGGSITAANGWRVKTLQWFREQWPRATFVEINAAISGTGSDYSACRLETDVLAAKPDLIFLECRVNGGGGYERQSVEGVVRRVWRQDPTIDLCFVYTIGQWMLPNIRDGRNVGFGTVMEEIANRYGIPSIDLGVEIAKCEQAGSLIFKGEAEVPGKVLFSRDGVHPGDAGHEIYRDVVARSLLRIADKAAEFPHALGEPMNPLCWETATLLPVTEAELSPGWTAVDPEKDPVYTDDAGRTRAMLRGAVACDRTGESITVSWRGTTVGFSDIPHGEPMVLEAVIDGKEPILLKREQREKIRKYARFVYLPEQEPGEHTVRFTVRELPEGNRFYAGHFLIVGTPVRTGADEGNR